MESSRQRLDDITVRSQASSPASGRDIGQSSPKRGSLAKSFRLMQNDSVIFVRKSWSSNKETGWCPRQSDHHVTC